jgi:hypothetical protein
MYGGQSFERVMFVLCVPLRRPFLPVSAICARLCYLKATTAGYVMILTTTQPPLWPNSFVFQDVGLEYCV